MKTLNSFGLGGRSCRRSRLGRALGGGLGGALLLSSSLGRAQAPAISPPVVTPPAAVTAPGTGTAAPAHTAAPTNSAAPPSAGAPGASPPAGAAPAGAQPAAEPTAAEKRLKAVEERLADLEGEQRTAEKEKDGSKNLLRIYGFTDVGVQRTWVSDKSIIGPYIASSNATNFVVGNLNLYLDAKPSEDWRFLGEVAFSSAPGGNFQVSSSPVPAGVLARLEPVKYGYADPSQPDGSYLFGGLVAIERAHIDWTHFSFLKVRVGQFFTPFGIYNVDHGTPVLITTRIPFFISSRMFPTRQTGIMLYGSTFAGPWELGYSAYVSNGRTELAPITFDDNRGLGGRLSAANEQSGNLTMKLGVSVYTGRVSNKVVDIARDPTGSLDANGHSTYALRETIAGADASFDVGSTRIRLEAAVARKVYDTDAREPDQLPTPVPLTAPNSWTTSAYAVVAHKLSFLNMEPYVSVAFHRTPWSFADTAVEPSGGLNFYITSAVTFRSQVARGYFFSSAGTRDTGPTASQQNLTTAMSRLIMSF